MDKTHLGRRLAVSPLTVSPEGYEAAEELDRGRIYTRAVLAPTTQLIVRAEIM